MIQETLFPDKPRGPKPPFDVTAGKHHGAETSREANLRTNKREAFERIEKFMRTRPFFESHLKEIVRETGMPVQTTSARLSDLKAMGRIEVVKGERRENCGVVRLIKCTNDMS